MKKILILADINSAHTQKWVLALLENEFDIYLFSLRNSNTNWHHNLANFKFASQTESNSNSLFSKLIYLKALPQVKKIIVQYQPDFLHAHYASSYGLIGALANFTPYYISVWGSDVFEFPNKSFITKRVLKFVFKKSTKIFSTGTVMAKEIQKYTSKTVEVVAFGIDTNKFIPTQNKVSSAVIQIGVIKTLAHTYGIDILIKSIAEATKQHQNIKLQIIGNGPLEPEYKSLVTSLQLDKYIEFVGKIPYNEIVNAYQQLDIFVNPSRFESFGVSILEASACGLPVIATTAGGQVELVKNNETGLLVEPENISQLAEAITTLIENKKLRAKFGQKGRAFVVENYDLKNATQQLIKHY